MNIEKTVRRLLKASDKGCTIPYSAEACTLREIEVELKKIINEEQDNWKVRLHSLVHQVNYYAEQKDINRNHTNYGAVSELARVMGDFGYKVEIFVWEDDGYLKIEKVTINGDTFWKRLEEEKKENGE